MADIFYSILSDCQQSARRASLVKGQHHLALFLPTGPMEFIVIEISGRLSRTNKGNQFTFMNTNNYYRTPWASFTAETSSSYVSTTFFDNWRLSYGTPSVSLKDNGSKCFAKLWKKLCLDLDGKYLGTTSYHTHISSQFERYKRILVPRLCHYIHIIRETGKSIPDP